MYTLYIHTKSGTRHDGGGDGVWGRGGDRLNWRGI